MALAIVPDYSAVVMTKSREITIYTLYPKIKGSTTLSISVNFSW